MTKENEEDIKVNRRSTDKVYFESPFVQSVYDSIDFLRDETKNILKDLDSNEFKQSIDEFDIEDFGEKTADHFSDIFDDLSLIRSKIINSDDLPEFVRDYSKNAKMALNRDEIYVRKAERKLNRINSDDELVHQYKVNIRIVELSDKAIAVNRLNWKAYYLKGLALTNLEKYDEAIEEFINSLALNEDNLDARLAIGNVNRLKREFNDALSIYDSVLRIDENSFEALLGKALTYYDWEKYGQACIFFKKADAIKALDEKYRKILDECSN